MSEDRQPVQIVPSVIKAQIDSGMKKAELAEFYNLPMTQMTKLLQQLGLKIRKFHAPKFVIVEEPVVEEVQEVEDSLEEVEEVSDNTDTDEQW